MNMDEELVCDEELSVGPEDERIGPDEIIGE